MKVSIITVCYNSENTIDTTLASVANQTYDDIEHIIIDGGSTDRTLEIIQEFKHVAIILSEPDEGIYDAMNKGIKMASGDVIGILNSDDHFTSIGVIEKVVETFRDKSVDIVYGDVQYIDKLKSQNIVRYYSSSMFKKSRLKYGFMPAHPSLYIKKECFDGVGYYKTDYSIAADFDMITRLFNNIDVVSQYIPMPMVNMLIGGVSTKGLSSTVLLNREILRSCKQNHVSSNWFYMIYRMIYKLLSMKISSSE